MARAGRRYSLLIYTFMLDRWWSRLVYIGLALIVLAWGAQPYMPTEVWRAWSLAGVGGVIVLAGLFLAVLRKAAYVQPFRDHLRLVTPFLRLNVSYKRVRRTSSAVMASLFPPAKMPGGQREIMDRLLRRTVVVVELNGFPISQGLLKLFLSPFFFKDKTPHFVFLVDDWLRFSTELESMRAGGGDVTPRKKPVAQSILARLPHKE